MKSLFKLVFIATIVFATKLAQADALDSQIKALQIDAPRMKEITGIVATNPDQPTKQIHDEYWGLLLTKIQTDPKLLSMALSSTIPETMGYQKELWKCLELSAHSRSVVRTENLVKYKGHISQSLAKIYQEKEQKMLEAAASEKPYLMGNGQQMIISEDLATAMVEKLNQSEIRLLKLYKPDWK